MSHDNNSPIDPYAVHSLDDLPVMADRIILGLRGAQFSTEDAKERQILGLMEEVGEVVGAYRRFTNRARRSGSREELARELADVLITATVTIREFDYPNPSYTLQLQPQEPLDKWVHSLFYTTARVVDEYDGDGVFAMDLSLVIYWTLAIASALQMDMRHWCEVKLREIFTRGWRDTNPTPPGDYHQYLRDAAGQVWEWNKNLVEPMYAKQGMRHQVWVPFEILRLFSASLEPHHD